MVCGQIVGAMSGRCRTGKDADYLGVLNHVASAVQVLVLRKRQER